MRLSLVRRFAKLYNRTGGLFKGNAVLVCGMALPFIVVPTTSLINGLAISIAMICAVVSSMTATALMRERLPFWARMAISANVSMLAVVLIYPVVGLLSPEMYDSLGIYLPLVAVNTMLLVRSQPCAASRRWYHGTLDGLLYSLGFSLVALVISALRELLGSGTLLGQDVWSVRVPGVSMVFSGFLMVGLLAALCNVFRRQILKILYLSENPRQPQEHHGEREVG